MAIFTTSLPDELLDRLSAQAKKLAMPKNKLIEQALNLYLEHLKRAAYIKSYKNAKEDEDILLMAEEGMADYLKQIGLQNSIQSKELSRQGFGLWLL